MDHHPQTSHPVRHIDTKAKMPLTGALLQERLLKMGYARLQEQDIETAAKACERLCVLALDNPERFPELADMLVILPELLKQFPKGSIEVAFCADQASIDLCQRYSVYRHPVLIFFHHGQHALTLEGLRSWSEYLNEFAAFMRYEQH